VLKSCRAEEVIKANCHVPVRLSHAKIVLEYLSGVHTEARDSEWQWHQLGHMQVCTSLQRDKHASTPPLSFLQAGCPSCRPTNRVSTEGTI